MTAESVSLRLLRLVLTSFERRRHPVEGVRQIADLVLGAHRAAMAERAGGERRSILLELPQRPHDAA